PTNGADRTAPSPAPTGPAAPTAPRVPRVGQSYAAMTGPAGNPSREGSPSPTGDPDRPVQSPSNGMGRSVPAAAPTGPAALRPPTGGPPYSGNPGLSGHPSPAANPFRPAPATSNGMDRAATSTTPAGPPAPPPQPPPPQAGAPGRPPAGDRSHRVERDPGGDGCPDPSSPR